MPDFELYRAKISGLSGRDFLDRFEEICRELHTELGVLTFGIIVYDESTPELRKVLRDKDYWDALDKASGNHLVIFTLADRTEVRSEAPREIRMITQFEGTSDSRTVSYSRLMHRVFGDEVLLVFPSVLFFQLVGDQVHNYRLVPLQRRDTFEAATAIQELFVSIANVLDRVAPENYGNQREIFNLVKDELSRQKYTVYMLRGPKLVSDLVGRIKSLLI